MRSVRKVLMLAAGLLISHWAGGQMSPEKLYAKGDSLKAFSLDDFYKAILDNHPVVSQAKLLNEMARQELRYARGSFDPKLAANADHKQFDDKTYYTKVDAAIGFPTWLPVNPKVGYQDHSGALLNAEERIPGQLQVYAGVSIPIGKGLITDERRTAVQQAMEMKTLAEADRVKIINKVLLEAAKDYWQWFFFFNQVTLLNQNLALSKEILDRTQLNALQGEAAGIDTIQAQINYQSRLIELQEAAVGLLTAEVQLSNYLWNDDNQPILISGLRPVMSAVDSTDISEAQLDTLVSAAIRSHPELVGLQAKINQIELEKSLAREMIKPQLDLNYYALSQPSAPQQFDPANDYKFGIDFSIPLFLRKERSKIALADAKVTSARLQKSNSQREITNQIKTTFYQFRTVRKIILQQKNMVSLYEKLMASELLNLENGESDLFKINVQQEKLIQAQIKLLKSQSELQKEKASLQWAAGNIGGALP